MTYPSRTPEARAKYYRRAGVAEARRAYQRAYNARKLAEESAEEREARLAYARLVDAVRRAEETPAEREARLEKKRERYRQQMSTPEGRERARAYQRARRARIKKARESAEG